jgi:hypothetical protein
MCVLSSGAKNHDGSGGEARHADLRWQLDKPLLPDHQRVIRRIILCRSCQRAELSAAMWERTRMALAVLIRLLSRREKELALPRRVEWSISQHHDAAREIRMEHSCIDTTLV